MHYIVCHVDSFIYQIRNAVNNDRLQSELRETLETMLVFLERKKARAEKYRSAVHQWLNGTPDETDTAKSCVRNTQLSLLTIMFVILTTLLFWTSSIPQLLLIFCLLFMHFESLIKTLSFLIYVRFLILQFPISRHVMGIVCLSYLI